MTEHKFRRTHRFPIINIIISLSLTIISFSQTNPRYNYSVDLTNVRHDRINVILDCRDFGQDQLIYHFPKVVPGTYTKSDFGRFIHKFQAFDQNGNELRCKKEGKNSFIISNASDIQTISYWVSDTWDMFFGHIRILPMEGTNIDDGRNFVINTFAVFGYFDKHVQNPATINFTIPEGFYGVSALHQTPINDRKVRFNAEDYHHLADCPIMFSSPDTVNFKIRNMEVTIGAYNEIPNTPFSSKVYEDIYPSVKAIGAFLDTLPADNYAFIYYLTDARKLGEILNAKYFKVPRAIGFLLTHRIPVGGALEHNNSTFSYSFDVGEGYEDLTMDIVSDISVHEFLHIITPLNLHSQYIDNFNYIEPKMSKHLWLYEGCTEYFAKLVTVKEDLITPKEFLIKKMRRKLIRGEKFPNEKMSFTEMSANVLKLKYKRHYNQVYQRGAVLAMLLDIEIIRLTEGQKTLLDVINELLTKYDKDHPFDEDSFIDEFVSLVHPDLKIFFDKYIEGREDIPYQEILNTVGVDYHKSIEENRPIYPIRENAVKYRRLNMTRSYEITRVKKDDYIGFQKGDIVKYDIFYNYFLDESGNYLPEDSTIAIPVTRNGKEIKLPVTIKYAQKTTENKINIMPEMTAEQRKYFNIWLGINE